MICKNCGYEQSDGAKFCSKCGEKIERIEQVPKPVRQAAPAAEAPSSVAPRPKKVWYKNRLIWLVLTGLVTVAVIVVFVFAKPDSSEQPSGEETTMQHPDAQMSEPPTAQVQQTDAAQPSIERTEPPIDEDAMMYQEALSLLEKGEYSAAKSAFGALGAYLDAAQYVNYCDALQQIESGEYLRGYTNLAALGKACGAQEYAVENGARDVIRLLERCDSSQAGDLMSSIYGWTFAALEGYESQYGYALSDQCSIINDASDFIFLHDLDVYFSFGEEEPGFRIRIWDNQHASVAYILDYTTDWEFVGWSHNDIENGKWREYDKNDTVLDEWSY